MGLSVSGRRVFVGGNDKDVIVFDATLESEGTAADAQDVVARAGPSTGATRVHASTEDVTALSAQRMWLEANSTSTSMAYSLTEVYRVPQSQQSSLAGPTNSISVSRRGEMLATGGDAKLVQLWLLPVTPPTGRVLGPPAWRFLCKTNIQSVAIHPAGDLLAVGTSSEHTEVYSLRIQDPAQLFCEPLMLVPCSAHAGAVAFARVGYRLLIGGNSTVMLVDVHSGVTLRKYERHGRVHTVALGPDGGLCAIGGFDRLVSVVDSVGGASVTAHTGEVVVVRSVHRSSSSSLLAVAGDATQGAGVVQARTPSICNRTQTNSGWPARSSVV